MPIERIQGEDTGIYREDRVRVTGPADMVAWLTQRSTEVAGRNPVDVLDAIERDAREVLRSHGFDDFPIRRTQRVNGHDLSSFGTYETDPPVVRDAERLLRSVVEVRDALSKVRNKATRLLVASALSLGRLAEQLRVRPFEEAAKLGRESLKRWHGQWVRVTDKERDILTIVGKRSEVPLSELLTGAWDDRLPPRNRSGQLSTGKVRTAFTGLNAKLSELRLPTLSLRRETVIIE